MQFYEKPFSSLVWDFALRPLRLARSKVTCLQREVPGKVLLNPFMKWGEPSRDLKKGELALAPIRGLTIG